MTTNNIHITITPKGQLYEARLGGDILTTSRTPFLSSARALLERGHSPDTVLTMSHAGEEIIALRGTIGAAAPLTVTENDTAGPRFARYRNPSADMTFAEVRGCARTGGESASARVAREAIGASL
ncbi:hypothetical protein [Bosea sp. (in: a-proteobacteria)]|uniref:hypothetical protein n=1 Tax=Bosea sp. (in: a-proteobacteria) TaxID=1871050 RepID=UPI001ACAE9DF|nr:hypothetical protein [Bosea sp. (in: a-proteobacteria)]MBN9442311.1 hypothetical protein [Bosea sp. (in: a-proteobacteria)]